MIVARRPTTRPSASIRCHFFSTSAGLIDLVVFISAFMGWDLFVKNRKRQPRGPAPVGGLIAVKRDLVKQIRALLTGKMLPEFVLPPNRHKSAEQPLDRPDGDGADVVAVQFRDAGDQGVGLAQRRS